MDSTEIFRQLASQGITALLLGFAVWWLNVKNQEQGEAHKATLAALNQERSDRIGKLETDVAECEKDRGRLWQYVVDIALKNQRATVQPPSLADTPPRPPGLSSTQQS